MFRPYLLWFAGLAPLLASQVSAQCTLCFLDQPQDPLIESQNCTDLANQAATIADENTDECFSVQVDAFKQCGCPPVAIPTDECPICEDDASFEANRTVYRQDEDPITCAELQALAGNDTTVCADIAKYRFYCGCSNVEIEDVSCGLCGPGNSTPVEERVLPGFAPDFVPAENYTCGEAQRQISLVTDSTTCGETQATNVDVSLLCGCILPPPPPDFSRVPCTSLCLDGSLIPESEWEKPALVDQPFFGTLNCYEYQLFAAQGLLFPRECNAAQYVGIKYCGCPITALFCDLCEDGSAVTHENLATQVIFQNTCLDLAGDSYFRDPADEACPAFQNTLGEYCGCDNPIASEDACRICDVPPGEVVPDSNQTLFVEGIEVDCGELEFSANDPNGESSCDQAQLIGVPCCANAPSATPTVTPAPTSSPAPTAPPTALSTPVATSEGTPGATPGGTPTTGTPEPTTAPPSRGSSLGVVGSMFVSVLGSGLLMLAA